MSGCYKVFLREKGSGILGALWKGKLGERVYDRYVVPFQAPRPKLGADEARCRSGSLGVICVTCLDATRTTGIRSKKTQDAADETELFSNSKGAEG